MITGPVSAIKSAMMTESRTTPHTTPFEYRPRQTPSSEPMRGETRKSKDVLLHLSLPAIDVITPEGGSEDRFRKRQRNHFTTSHSVSKVPFTPAKRSVNNSIFSSAPGSRWHHRLDASSPERPSQFINTIQMRPHYLENNFIEKSKLGLGKFTEVISVVNQRAQSFAVKKIFPHTAVALRSGRNELTVLSELHHHPHIVKLFDVWEQDDSLCMLLELCETNLRQYQEDHHSLPSDDQVYRCLVDVLLALSHIHMKGYIHRDLRPDNILLTKSGRFKLCDFGISESIDAERVEWDGDRYYLPLEVLLHSQAFPASDVFSLGLIALQFALDIDLPGEGLLWDALRQGTFMDKLDIVQEELNDPLKELFVAMLHPDPDQRPSAVQLLNEHEALRRVFAKKIQQNEYTLQELDLFQRAGIECHFFSINKKLTLLDQQRSPVLNNEEDDEDNIVDHHLENEQEDEHTDKVMSTATASLMPPPKIKISALKTTETLTNNNSNNILTANTATAVATSATVHGAGKEKVNEAYHDFDVIRKNLLSEFDQSVVHPPHPERDRTSR